MFTSLFSGASGLRLMKTLLVFLIAFFAFLVALNNVTDYNSNFMFVQHVLTMDTTFEGNKLMWRAIDVPILHHVFYWAIIALELSVALICGAASWRMVRAIGADTKQFDSLKVMASWGLVVGILLWFGGFMAVGAEWFVMWQSPIWNGQEAAFRFIMCLFGTLIFLNQPEPA